MDCCSPRVSAGAQPLSRYSSIAEHLVSESNGFYGFESHRLIADWNVSQRLSLRRLQFTLKIQVQFLIPARDSSIHRTNKYPYRTRFRGLVCRAMHSKQK